MRAFIAIALNDEIRRELSLLQSRIESHSATIKCVLPENIHLTLKFLGEISEKLIQPIESRLGYIVKGCEPFSLRLGTLGAFPKIASPRIIWIGLIEGSSDCCRLRNKIENSMAGLGFQQEERPFSPHLTLARTRPSIKEGILKKAIETEKDLALKSKVTVNEITLFKSTLTAKGPVYTILRKFSFL